VLRTAILDAVSRESARVATPSGLAITGLARPWADARLAIARFAARLADACSHLPRAGN